MRLREGLAGMLAVLLLAVACLSSRCDLACDLNMAGRSAAAHARVGMITAEPSSHCHGGVTEPAAMADTYSGAGRGNFVPHCAGTTCKAEVLAAAVPTQFRLIDQGLVGTPSALAQDARVMRLRGRVFEATLFRSPPEPLLILRI